MGMTEWKKNKDIALKNVVSTLNLKHGQEMDKCNQLLQDKIVQLADMDTDVGQFQKSLEMKRKECEELRDKLELKGIKIDVLNNELNDEKIVTLKQKEKLSLLESDLKSVNGNWEAKLKDEKLKMDEYIKDEKVKMEENIKYEKVKMEENIKDEKLKMEENI